MRVDVVGTSIKAGVTKGLTPKAQALVDKARKRFVAQSAKEVQSGK